MRRVVASVSGARMMVEMLRELVDCECTEEHFKLVEHFYAGVTKTCDCTSDQRGPSAAFVVKSSIVTRCVVRSSHASDVLHRVVGLKTHES